MKTPIYACAAILVLVLTTLNLRADATWLYTVQISAVVQSSPPRITLSWPADEYGANSYTVYRKAPGATSWGAGTTLSGTTLTYVDSNVAVGQTYEYQIIKVARLGYTGYGYILAGMNAPLVENRGKVILVVDNSFASSLASELTVLQSDLVGDGWTVVRRDVSRNDTPANVRNIIRSDYNADPGNVKAVFLFGHIPILRSGNLNVDGHQARQMPADGFYGDMNGTWNNPSTIPSDLELQVGRVDLWNMPGTGAPFPSELELLRQYLKKDHNFRHRVFTAPRRALMGNRFGDMNGEAFAASGFRNFEPFFGRGNTILANELDNAPSGLRWSSMLDTGSYLWAYGCGGGSYTSMSMMGTHGGLADMWSTDFYWQDSQAVFYMMCGSWFGEWDARDNLMRAALCTPTMGLTAVWAGRPHWFFHHMALGETIGYGARLSQNNGSLYRNQVNSSARGVHMALMGDPTLRMHPIVPVSALTGSAGGGAVNLNWRASTDSVLGYHVYRATNPSGPFTRLTSTAVGGTSFSDTTMGSGTFTYMVRAVKLESTPSGTYFNPSQGIFVTVNSSGGTGGDSIPPAVGLTAPANNAAVSGSVTVSANATDNVGVAGVQFKLDGANLGAEDTSAPYSVTWHTAGAAAGAHVLTATARDAAGNRMTSSAVSVTVSNGGGSSFVWVDDSLPAGAVPGADGGDAWTWVTSNPAPFSGTRAHRSSGGTGSHQHYFSAAETRMPVNAGDALVAHVYLDPANTPSAIMLQWNDGSWEHRAYWGANSLNYGVNGTVGRRSMGALPAAGQWVRLEVPASAVGLEGKIVKGMAFTQYGGRATWDAAGRAPLSPPADTTAPAVSITAPSLNATVSGAVTVSANATDNVGVVGVQFKLNGANLGSEDMTAPYTASWNTATMSNGMQTLTAVARDAAGNRTTSAAASVLVSNAVVVTVVWVEDALPPGAIAGADGGDSWNWVTSSPAPFSGTRAHRSNAGSGLHQHYFNYASTRLSIAPGDTLFAYVYLDPANPPSEVMLQWTDGTWEHRAYWGANNISAGANGTASRRFMGALPATGRWVKLEVPASQVGLEGRTVKGMAFTLFGGRATWDQAGKSGL